MKDKAHQLLKKMYKNCEKDFPEVNFTIKKRNRDIVRYICEVHAVAYKKYMHYLNIPPYLSGVKIKPKANVQLKKHKGLQLPKFDILYQETLNCAISNILEQLVYMHKIYCDFSCKNKYGISVEQMARNIADLFAQTATPQNKQDVYNRFQIEKNDLSECVHEKINYFKRVSRKKKYSNINHYCNRLSCVYNQFIFSWDNDKYLTTFSNTYKNLVMGLFNPENIDKNIAIQSYDIKQEKYMEEIHTIKKLYDVIKDNLSQCDFAVNFSEFLIVERMYGLNTLFRINALELDIPEKTQLARTLSSLLNLGYTDLHKYIIDNYQKYSFLPFVGMIESSVSIVELTMEAVARRIVDLLTDYPTIADRRNLLDDYIMRISDFLLDNDIGIPCDWRERQDDIQFIDDLLVASSEKEFIIEELEEMNFNIKELHKYINEAVIKYNAGCRYVLKCRDGVYESKEEYDPNRYINRLYGIVSIDEEFKAPKGFFGYKRKKVY